MRPASPPRRVAALMVLLSSSMSCVASEEADAPATCLDLGCAGDQTLSRTILSLGGALPRSPVCRVPSIHRFLSCAHGLVGGLRLETGGGSLRRDPNTNAWGGAAGSRACRCARTATPWRTS